jgi:hypothetical protein
MNEQMNKKRMFHVVVYFQISYDVFEQYVLPSINDFVFGGWSTATPDSLFVALSIHRRFKVSINDYTLIYAMNILCSS